jgi:LysR family cys regulon transcriptional activator
MAIDPQGDADLAVLDADHLFAPHLTWIGFRRGRLLRGYMYEFLKVFAPHLSRRLVDQAIRAGSGDELDQLFRDVALPSR